MLILRDLVVYIIMCIGLWARAESKEPNWVTEILGLKTKKRQAGPERSRGKLAAVQMKVYLRIDYSKRNDLSRKKAWFARGMTEAVDQGCEDRVRSEARAGVEFRCAGNSRTKVFMEGCQKPLKPNEYISFMACSAGHLSRAMR